MKNILEIKNLTKYYGDIKGVEDLSLELEEGEYNTLNGYIINQLGEIPKSNEKVEIKVENVNIEVVKVSNKKIEKVKVSYIN